MADDVALRFTSQGASQVKRDLDNVRSSASQLGKDAAVAEGGLTKASLALSKFSSSASVLGTIHPVFGQIAAGADQVGASLGKVQTESAATGGGLAAIASGVNVATASLIGLAAIGEHSFLTVGRAVKDFQNVTGLAADDSSKLVGIMRAVGVPTDAAALAFFRFGKNIETNAKTLEKYGVQIARNRDGTVNILNTLYAVSDAYRANADQTQRNALVQAAFGRGGAAVIEVLQRTRGELKSLADQTQRSGLVFSQDQLNQVENFGIAMQQLKMAGQGLAISLARGVTPALTDVAHVLTPIIDLLSRTGILAGTLTGVMAGQLVRAIVAATASMLSWVASLGTVNIESRLAIYNVAALGEVQATVAPAMAAAATGTAGFGAALSAAAGPAGIIVGVLAGSLPILSQVEKKFQDLDGAIKQMARESGPALQSTFEALGRRTEQPGSLPGRAVRGLFGAEDSDKKQAEAFRQVAGQDIALAQRIIEQRRAAGLSTAEFDRILKSTIETQRQMNADSAESARILGDVGGAADAATTKVGNLGATFGVTLDLFSSGLTAARNYASELDKLDAVASDTSTSQAKLARDSAAASDALANAKQRQADAEEKYHTALAGVTPLERERLAVSLEQARVSQQQAGLELATAKDRQARLSSGASPKQRAEAELAVAQAQANVDDSNTRVAESQKAVDDARPGSVAYAKNLATAERELDTAKRAVADAQDKQTESEKKAAEPTKTLAQHQRDVADQLDRTVQAAKSDWAAQIAAGAVTSSGAVFGLASQLQSLADKFPALAGQINAYLGTLPQWATTPFFGTQGVHGGVRASGGPVVGGQRYVVGDQGNHPDAWEILELNPGSSGRVYSNTQSRSMTSSGMRRFASGGVIARVPSGAGGYDGASMPGGKTTVERYEFGEGAIAVQQDMDAVMRAVRHKARVASLSRASRRRG